MAGNKGPAESWQKTTIVLRADILDAARKRGIDISDAANRALAETLGIDYRQQRLDDVATPPPVIIARDGSLPARQPPAAEAAPRPPVINADDPLAAGSIAKTRKQPVKRPAPAAAPEPEKKAAVRSPEKIPAPAPAPAVHKKPAKKAGKDDALKKFIAATIVRGDGEDTSIPKGEFYALFARWCREQKVAVPDMKEVTVALKTRFAFREKSVGGSPCWTHVRIR